MVKKEWPSFDELRRLAEQSPERLEAFRTREIEALIARAPEQLKRRLRGLQFQVNCQRRLHRSPLGSCIAISKMMHESLVKLQAVLNGSHTQPSYESYDDPRQSNVIPFVS
ncbi:MAG: DUF3135 domain-containing protein [Agarilytica sp.]